MTLDPDAVVGQLQSALDRDALGAWRARHEGALLESHFQPIYSFPHRRAVGHEALLRITQADGRPLPPLVFFERLPGAAEQLHADRLSRLLHVRNFARQADTEGWLFLNIHPSVFVHGARQPEMVAASVGALVQAGLQPKRIVFEVTEEDRKSTRLNSSHSDRSRMPSSA